MIYIFPELKVRLTGSMRKSWIGRQPLTVIQQQKTRVLNVCALDHEINVLFADVRIAYCDWILARARARAEMMFSASRTL